jgi:aspartate/methionine/tyrosine aminotransferase
MAMVGPWRWEKDMNPIAAELNDAIRQAAPYVCEMLSDLGRGLYFPKGILSQSAEAKQKAKRCNATIGIAKENGEAMHLPSIMKQFSSRMPDELLPYAPATGKPELRAKWREDLYRKNPSLEGKEISLPVVTSGVTHGLSLAADLFVDPGDAVLVPDKLWGNYNMIFGVRHGAEMLKYPFFSGSSGFNVDGFRRAIAAHADRQKVVVLLNFPNNPTGYSITEQEASAICDALAEAAEDGCNVLALCDDAYFGLFYDDECMKESIFARLAGLHERILAVKLDGATKEDFVWGLRVGFLTFAAVSGDGLYNALEKKAGGAIRGNISNCSHASQSVVLRAMSESSYEEEKRDKFEVLKARAAKVKEVLADERFSAVWQSYPFNSGYFMCLRLNDLDAEQFRLRLLDKYGIGVIAVGGTDIRVAFSCVEEQEVPELFELMYKCAQEMKAGSLTSQ